MLNSNLRVSQEGIDIIKQFEGFSARPYCCPSGVWTIGYGHTGGVNACTPSITKTEAEELLKRDVKKAADVVRNFVRSALSEKQFAALVSFVFNIGEGNFIKSTLLKRLNMSDHDGAALEFMRWIHADGRKLEGLVNRREAEQKLFWEGS